MTKFKLQNPVIHKVNLNNKLFQFKDEENFIKIIKNNNEYKIYFDNYPFRPPRKLVVNNTIIDYSFLSSEVSHIIKKYLKINCLRCSSILCSDNWYINCMFSDIIKEYEYFNKIINLSKNIKIFLGLSNNQFPNEINDKIISFIF